MKRLLVFVMILMLAIPVGIANADDPAVGSKEDNACNPGGAMEGKCTTEWHWVCGYYMARFSSGSFSRAQVPAICSSLLPPLPPAEIVVGDPFCMFGVPFVDSLTTTFDGVNRFVNVLYMNSSNGTCTQGSFLTVRGFYGTAAEAIANCGIAAPFSSFYPNAPSNLYLC